MPDPMLNKKPTIVKPGQVNKPSTTSQPAIIKPAQPTISSAKTPYQQNISQPVQQPQNSWYSGTIPTTSEMYGRIKTIGQTDYNAARDLTAQFIALQQDKSSPWYNPYMEATNQAVANLQAYGIDTNMLTDEWFANNTGWQNRLRFSTTTNGVLQPLKKTATDEDWIAYNLYQYQKSMGDTSKAEIEWQALQQELAYKANNKSRNQSDDEIIDSIDWSKYSTLKRMKDSFGTPSAIELNKAIDFSDDAMRGVLWAARNNGGTGSIIGDMANSALGEGNAWKDDPSLQAKLNWNDKNTYDPYSVGATVDEDALMYFGVYGVDEQTLEHIRKTMDPNDETAMKMYGKIASAWETTKTADEELNKLYKKLNKFIADGKSEEFILNKLDSFLKGNDYKTLKAMDESIENGSDLLKLTKAVPYKKANLVQQIKDLFAEKEAQASAADLANNGLNTPGETPADVRAARERDQKTRDAAGIFDDDATPEEAAVFSGYSGSQDAAKGTLSTVKDSVSNPEVTDAKAPAMSELYTKQTGAATKSYIEGTSKVYGTVNSYETKQGELAAAQETVKKLEGELGAKVYAGQTNSLSYTTEINGVQYNVTLAPDLSGVASIEQMVSDDYTVPIYDNGEDAAIWDEVRNSQELASFEDSYRIKEGKIEEAAGLELTEEDKMKLEALRRAQMQVEDAEKYLYLNKDEYEKALADYNSANERWQAHIQNMADAGVDTYDIEVANVVMKGLTDFTDYEATVWESYNPSQAYAMAIEDGTYSKEEVLKFAEADYTEAIECIKDIEWLQQYAKDHNIQLPENIKQNMERRLAKHKRDIQDYEFFKLQWSEDFKGISEEGRVSEYENRNKKSTFGISTPFDGMTDEEYFASMMKGEYEPEMYGSKSLAGKTAGMCSLMTDEEVNTYFYLTEKDKLNGTNQAGEYLNFLMDPSYGVLYTRKREQIEQEAREMTDSGFGGFLAANTLSVLMSPYNAISSGAMWLYNKATGSELNPNSGFLAMSHFRTATREQSAQEILEAFGEKNEDGTYKETTLSQIAQGGYEILTNRLDSAMNSMAFGGFFGGVGNEMLREFLSAAPMGASAAMEAAAQAKEKGASDAQAYAIAAVTFFAETGTEAISLENMKEALKIGEEMSVDTFKKFAINWLKKAGISEAFGESVNDIIEKFADEKIMGELSEHAELVEKYLAENPDISRKEAEAMARRDEINGVLRTALISYLSPGLDVFQTAKGRIKGYQEAKTKWNKEHPDQKKTIRQIRTEIRQQEKAGKSPAQVTQSEAAAGQETGVPTQAETPENAARQEQLQLQKKQAESTAVDFEILETGKGGDKSAQNAAISAVLDETRTVESGDESDAAATMLHDVLGDRNAASEVQDLLIGANAANSNIPHETIKQGIRYAALGGEQSECRKVMQSDAYQKATPAVKASMLAEAVKVDQQNQALIPVMQKAVRDFRVAKAEAKLLSEADTTAIDNAEAEALQKEGVTLEAQKKVNNQRAVEQAAFEAARQAGLYSDAKTHEAKLGIAKKQNEVRKSYEAGLEAAQREEKAAKEKAEALKKQRKIDIRQQAEQMVAQEDQQRLQQAEQDRIAAEKQAADQKIQQASKDESDTAHNMEVDTFIDQNYPNATEEQKQHIREIAEARRQAMQAEQVQTQPVEQQPVQPGEKTSLSTTEILNRKKIMEGLNRKFGIKIRVVDTTKGGQVNRQNGYYDEKTNTITIDSQTNANQMMYFVLAHELTHIAERAGQYYRSELANALLRISYGDEADYEGILNGLKNGTAKGRLAMDIITKKALYDDALAKMHQQDNSIDNTPLTYEEALQEIIADSMGEVLFKGNQDLIVKLATESPSAARRILDSIKSFLKRSTGMSGEWRATAERTVSMLEKALKDSQKETNKQSRTSQQNNNPGYLIRKSYYSDNLTIRFDRHWSEKEDVALRKLGMVPYKDGYGWGWRFSKGVKLTSEEIENALKQANKPDGRRNQYSLDAAVQEDLSYAVENPVNNFDTDSDLPIQERKDGLMAVHNVTLPNFMKSLQIGGIANPSAAVVSTSTPWNMYGEISVFLDRFFVDPQIVKNLYSGDAMTPMLDGTFESAQEALAWSANQPDVDPHTDMTGRMMDQRNIRSIDEARERIYRGKQTTPEERARLQQEYKKMEIGIFQSAMKYFNFKSLSGKSDDAIVNAVYEAAQTISNLEQDDGPMSQEERISIVDDKLRVELSKVNLWNSRYHLTGEEGTALANQILNYIDYVDTTNPNWMLESKPGVVVRPDQFAAVLVPQSIGNEAIQQMVDAGIPEENIMFYDDSVANDAPGGRDEVMASIPMQKRNVQFSLPTENVIATDENGDALAEELRGGTVALNTGTQYSLNSFTKDEQDRVRAALLAHKDENGNQAFTEEDVDQYMGNALGLAAMIAADRERLDFEANPAQKFLKPNNDYHFTLDASTLCAKRLLYQGTFDYVQHALPDEVFTPEDLIDLVNIMSEMGYETPCGICYVESRRRWLDTYAKEFINKVQKDADSFVEKRFKKASDEEKAALRERLAGEMPSIEDLTTSDGLEKLRTNDPLMHKAFLAAMNAKGTANPKVVQLRTEYNGDISKLTANDIQKVKDIGGLRIQSFSDFETPHLLDMVQAVMDMSSVGLTSQAYTKVANFAWVFGDTGIKINLSLIGKGTGLDADGNLVFDNVEGMNFDEAMRLRDRYSKNVGTILVGINDDHIIAAMADPRIDFIIPFHKSGWSDNELKGIPSLNNYKDYTASQNEKKLFGKDENGNWIRESDGSYKTIPGKESKLKNFEPVGAHKYWEFDKSGEWNARKYLKMCADDGRIPKFSQFLVDNGDGSFSLPEGDDKRSTAIRTGYWKTLIDFKMYDNDGNGAEQTAVTPNINMNQAQRVLNEHKLGRQMPDRPDGRKGIFIPMESNNDVPVAVPAAEVYIEKIRQKRAGNKPKGPDDTLKATPPAIKVTNKQSAFHQNDTAMEGTPNAGTAAMASGAEAVLGNTETQQEETMQPQQNAMAMDAETGEVLQPRRIRHSLPSDAPYLAAVERGDMETAQQMVDEVAEQVSNNSKVRNPDGTLLKMYHGTNADFTEFRRDMIGSTGRFEGSGFNFTPYEGRASSYGKNVFAGYLNIQKPLSAEKKTLSVSSLAALIRRADPTGDNIIADYARNTSDYGKDSFVRRESITAARNIWESSDNDVDIYSFISAADSDAESLIHEFENLGYDGLIHYDDNGNVKTAVAFNSNQFKLADPVTYDDNGNVIPLSERFNDQKEDIRYSLPSDNILDQQYRYYLDNGGIMSAGEPQGPQRQFGSQTAQERDVLNDSVLQYLKENSSYTPDTNAAELARALRWVDKNKSDNDPDGYQRSLERVTSKSFNYLTKDGQAKTIAVMGMAVAKNDVNAQVQIADAYNKEGTALGQALQARKLFRLMTPEGRIAAMRKTLSNAQDEINRKGSNIQLEFSNWIYQAAAAATEEGDFEKVRQAAMEELAQQIPASWKDRLRSLRMLSMLANPRTHIRNIVGNALFIPAVSLKNKMGAIGEIITGQEERTKTLSLVSSKEVRDFARQDANNIKGLLTGEAKYSEATQIAKAQSKLGKALDWASEKNSNALEKEDWIFLKGHYRRALGGWMTANGYTVEQVQNDTELLEKGRQYAINEAQKATYRDFNKTAAALNEVSRKGGVAGFLVDAALPFKKTPANILKRGIEYSPVGIVKALSYDMYHMKQWMDYQNGKLNALPEKAMSPNQVIDDICAGLSGTVVMTLGFLLAGTGAVSCGLDDDEDKFGKEQGEQEYAINPGKIGNDILGMFGVPKLFGEDVTYTLDWAAPMSMPLFVGAAIRNQTREEGSVDFEEAFNALGSIMEPVFNLSMLDGINTLFKTSSYDNTNPITQILAKIVTNYASSYVPSALGAVNRTLFDDKQRKAFVEQGKGTGVMGTIRYMLEQMQNKIPGLAQQNIAARDIWGNEKTTYFMERLFENFISPGYIEHVENDPIINEMARVYEATGSNDSGLVPKDPDKSISFTLGGVKHEKILTDKEWDQLKAVRGQTALKELTELMNNPDYQNAIPSAQAKMIKDVWNHATQIGKEAVWPEFDAGEPQSVTSIARGSKLSTYKTEIVKALRANNYEAYDTMVEAMQEEYDDPGDADSAIREKLRDTFGPEWKKAYKNNDYATMYEIEEWLDYTGYDFNIYGSNGWQEKVDEAGT